MKTNVEPSHLVVSPNAPPVVFNTINPLTGFAPRDKNYWISGSKPRALQYAEGTLKRQDLEDCERFHLTLRCVPGPRKVEDVISQYRRIVIIGDPGSGKSVLLLKFLRAQTELLRDRLSSMRRTTGPITIPVYVELGQLKPFGNEVVIQRSLEELICRSLGVPAGGNPLDSILRLLEEDNVELLMLLDGLNELSEYQKVAVDQLFLLDNTLIARNWHDRVRVVATSRSYGFTNCYANRGYEVVEIVPLDPDDIHSELLNAFPDYRDDIDQLYQSLNPKDRQVLSNPQNLDNFISFCRQKIQDGELLAPGLPSRGVLLRYFVERRLGRLDTTARELAERLLGDLAYRTCQGGVFFLEDQVWQVSEEVLSQELLCVNRARTLSHLIGTGLLVRVDDHLRFSHHSIQQYFAALEMRSKWHVSEYVHYQLWHEPMVIMAGLLDQDHLHELLDRLRGLPRLFSYVLANVHESTIEQEFLRESVDAFVGQTRRWAVKLWRKLAVAAILWALGLPLIFLILGSLDPNEISTLRQIAILFLVLAYVAAGPATFLMWYRSQFRSSMDRLRNRTLPDLIAVLRFLQARGAMNSVIRELSKLRRNLRADRQDPRIAFLTDAELLVSSAVSNQSYMTEDQMLENLDDPLVAEEIEPERLSSKNLDRLFAIALEAEDGPAVRHALERLRELYVRSPEHREQVRKALDKVATASNRSRRTRKQAVAICQELTGRQRGMSLFARFIEKLRLFFRKPRRGDLSTAGRNR